MSWTRIAARSLVAPVTAILNLRGRYANSGWNVDHWRSSSVYGRGSTDLVAGHAREVVARDVADAVAGGLDRVHFDPRQLGQDVGHLLELRPVVLDVLARGEVAVAAVVVARDVRERAQLPRRQLPVGNRHAQHRRVLLDVQAVLQPQRAKLVLGQLAGEIAARLVAELGDAFVDDALVEMCRSGTWRDSVVVRSLGAPPNR